MAGERLLEDEGVGEDGHGHAARLRAVFEAQVLGEEGGDGGVVGRVGFGENFASQLDIALEDFGEDVDLFGGAHGLLGEEGEVTQAAMQPTAGGPAFGFGGQLAAVEGVFEVVAGTERGLQLRFGVRAERGRAAQGDAGLDGVVVIAQRDSEAITRFVFDVLGW